VLDVATGDSSAQVRHEQSAGSAPLTPSELQQQPWAESPQPSPQQLEDLTDVEQQLSTPLATHRQGESIGGVSAIASAARNAVYFAAKC
jgi:hypothetical protein